MLFREIVVAYSEGGMYIIRCDGLRAITRLDGKAHITGYSRSLCN
jgi:hypothetical protein